MSTVFKIRFIPNEVCQLSWHGMTSSSGIDKRRKFQKRNLGRVTWSYKRLKRTRKSLLMTIVSSLSTNMVMMKLMRRTKVKMEEENSKHKKMADAGFRRGNP